MKIKGIVVLAIVGGVSYWAYKTRPTVTGLVDSVTKPLMRSKAVVKESEHKRVLGEAAPAAAEGEPVPTTMVREGMKKDEVEELLGRPDHIEELREDGRTRVRWTYNAAGRVLLFEKGRVISITVR